MPSLSRLLLAPLALLVLLVPLAFNCFPRGFVIPASWFAVTKSNEASDTLVTSTSYANVGATAKQVPAQQSVALAVRWPKAVVQLMSENKVFLPRGTIWPYVGAIAGGVVFWLLALLMFPSAASHSDSWGSGSLTKLQLMGSIALTALTCIFALKVIWWYGRYCNAVLLHPDEWASNLHIVLGKFVHNCYSVMKDKHSYPSLTVLLAYIFGVGLCEEAIKFAWAFFRGESEGVDGRVALGFCSGVGFGVAECVHYCTNFYDGQHNFYTYLVRFVSLVALHGSWTAISALLVRGSDHKGLDFCRAISCSMVLHGFYNHSLHTHNSGRTILMVVLTIVIFGVLYIRARTRE
jgi:hypothetical protein